MAVEIEEQEQQSGTGDESLSILAGLLVAGGLVFALASGAFGMGGGSMNTAPTTTYAASKQQYVTLATQDATNAGINPTLFLNQIQQESGFDPNAVSPAGAIGIAQFMPATAAGMGIDPHDPVAALKAAAQLDAANLARYGSEDKALACYNAGCGAVDRAVSQCGTAWKSCLPLETQNYIAIIER